MNAEKLIGVLNRLLEAEFMAMEYYTIHADAIPESEIAEGIRSIVPVEGAHAVNLTTRIKELGGVPMAPGGEASRRGREMGEQSRRDGTLAMLKFELVQEQLAIVAYAEPIADILHDMVTLEMLEEQLFDEMRHAKWLKMKVLEFNDKK